MHFSLWLTCIDRILFSRNHCHIEDLPDEDFREHHEAGLSPTDMVNIMISNIELLDM